MPTPLFKIYPISEQALTIQLGEAIDEETRLKVLSVFQLLQKERPDYFLDIIPAYADITVVYDLSLKKHHASAFEFVKGELQKQLNKKLNSQPEHSRHLKIPVCYESEFAMDARLISRKCSMTFDRMIELHTAGVYEVFMIGFLPGFAYMGPLDRQLETPRLSTPRKRVPSGSVGIAGLQTGIYPLDSPGGWNIIGRSPLLFFDAHRGEPTLFQHGDRVSFVPISNMEFKNTTDYRNHKISHER